MNIPIENEIFEGNPNPVIILNKSTGQLIEANQASEHLLKFWKLAPQEFMPLDMLESLVQKSGKKNKEIEIHTGAFSYGIRLVQKNDLIILYAQDITSSVVIKRKLQEVDESYRLLAQHASDIISRLSLQSNYLYISPSCKTLLGYEPEELLGKNMFEFIHEEDSANFKSAYFPVLDSDQSSTITCRFKCKNGEYKWFESILKKIKGNSDFFEEVLCVARDISQRMGMERALRQSEELHKSVVNNLGEGLIMMDLNGKINFVNSAIEKITGTTQEELQGNNISEFMKPDKFEQLQKRLGERANGKSESYEFFAELKNGEKKWLEVKAAPYKNIKQEIIGAIAAITDVTKKKYQEEEIAKLSLVASRTDNGIIFTNANGEIEWVNDSFTKISGYESSEILGKVPGSFLQGPNTDANTIHEIREKMKLGKSFDILILNYAKNKKTYWAQLEITPLHNDQGELTSYFSIHRDSTEKILTLELLKESEQRYKNLLSASFEGIVVHNDGIILDCNARFAAMLGYTYEEVINTPIYNFIPEQSGSTSFLLDENMDRPIEYVALKTNDTILPVELISKKHQYKQSTVRVTLLLDLSERIKTQEKLKESEIRYRDLVETSSNFIYTVNEHGDFLYVNSVGIRKTGYTLEEFRKMNFIELIHENWKEKVADFYKKQFTNKIQESYFELPIMSRTGEEIWLGQNVQMIIDNNWINGFQAYARDISERKNIEIELDKQKYLLNLILDILPIPVFLKNAEGKYLFVNNEAKKFYQLPDDSDPQIPIDLFPNDYFERYEHANDSVLSEEKIHLNNTDKYILLGKKMIKPDLINEAMLLGYFIDISDRKKAEEALISAKHTAEESMLAKERFISIMSHEIRTPMNAVVGITNLLVQQSHSEEQKEYLHALKTSSDNLLKILNNILDLSKLESGKITFEEINFDIREILSEVQETFKFKAAEKNIEIKNAVSSFVPTLLKGDPLRLHQVLVNLVSNSLKFTSEGKIVVEVKLLEEKQKELHLQFSVKDTGIGIPQNKLVEIFESFTQVSTDTSRKFGGTGLGLTITKRLIELQGGTITVESEIDKGSVFTFDLKFYKTSRQSFPPEAQQSYNLAGIKLLLVEDNEMNQLVVLRFLEKENIEVVIAENGKRATEILEIKKFDIILMDLQMPEMDGYEATKFIRKMKNSNTSIPIIAFTASSASDIESKIKISGMTDFITKPFEPTKLYDIIKKYVQKENEKTKIVSFKQPEKIKTMNHKKRQVIDLEYLKEASNGNMAFIKNMIEIFLKQTPGYLAELEQSNEQKDWDRLKKIIHKMKPTIPMMGIKMQDEVAAIEDAAKNQHNLETLPSLLSQLRNACEAAYLELNEELLHMS